MSLGKVISMYNPRTREVVLNSGVLMDVATGITYEFSRPAITGDVTRWNVELHAYVSFTISDGRATAVTLYKRPEKGLVISSL